MKKCRHCGAPIEDLCDTICAYCGEPLGNSRIAEEQYPHQEYTQQHTAQQYTQHTSQHRTQTPYEQHLPNTINPYDTKRTEAQGRAATARMLAILAIPLCYVFILAIIAICVASSAENDPHADEASRESAKKSKKIAIVALILGILFQVGQIIATIFLGALA